MRHIKTFENFDDRELGTLSGMDHPDSLKGWEDANKKECSWCYSKFLPKTKHDYCCSSECESKYNNSLTNDNAEKPYDKFQGGF